MNSLGIAPGSTPIQPEPRCFTNRENARGLDHADFFKGCVLNPARKAGPACRAIPTTKTSGSVRVRPFPKFQKFGGWKAGAIIGQLLGYAAWLAVMNAAAATNTVALPGWRLVWSDEFKQPDGSALDPAKWRYDTGGLGWGNQELEYYTL